MSLQVDRAAVLGFVRIDLFLAGQTEAGWASLAGDRQDDLVPERSGAGGPQVPPGVLNGGGQLLSLPDSRPQVL